MDLQGKVIAVLPAREGTSARGPWKSQEYVIETHDQYPKKMISMFLVLIELSSSLSKLVTSSM